MAEDAPAAPAPQRPRRRRRWITALIVLAAIVALTWTYRATRPVKRRPPPAPVAVTMARADQRDLPVHLDTIGTVTSLYTVSITSQVNGVIQAVHYQEGQLVKPGTLLVEIDSRPFQAALQQAQGTLERDVQLLAEQRQDLERYRAAWAANAVARQILENQEHLVRQTEGVVTADRGALQTAQIQLQYTRITSPIAGRVGLRLVDPGNLVTAQGTTPLVVITQVQPISVVFPVSEDDLGQLLEQPNHGQGLQVTAFDRTRTRALSAGVLRTIDNQIDTTTGTVRARAFFENAKRELFPNQFVNTRVLVKTLRGVVTLPSSAIQRDGQKTFVYVIDSGRAHVVPVKVGVSDGERTEVQGIAAGTQVADSSFEKLREGVPITPSEEVRQARPMPGGTVR